jgi:hypothetical protein
MLSAMSVRTRCDRAIARRRRGRSLAWCVFLLLIASVFAARILLR